MTMTAEEQAQARVDHEAWIRQHTPFTLGSDHFWGQWPWETPGKESKDDLGWAHRCTNHGHATEPVLVLARLDVTTGRFHRLASKEPLTIVGSILCVACGDHGFIRDGIWVVA